jgi:hypothetical protein
MQSPHILHVHRSAAIHPGHMRKHTRKLLIGLSAICALGTLSACSGGSSTQATSTAQATATSSAPATPAPFPQSAKYIADTEAAGKKMVIGVAVDGGKIAAYACNGTDDEAWFFGNSANGNIDLTSRFRDTLKASFDGSDVKGGLTMNGVTYTFSAAEVPAPAGMYTAALDGVRSSWVLRPDGSTTGVQFSGISGRDFEQAELQQLKDDQFRAEVRNRRILQQAQQLNRQANGSYTSTINGKPVTAVWVNGDFRLS